MEPTHERELTRPVNLCGPDGRTLNPEALGWSRTPLHRANLRNGWGRTKRWDYWAVLAGDHAFGIVYADVDYLGLASVWWGNLATGQQGGAEVAVPLSRGIRLPEVPGAFPLSFANKKLRLRISDAAGNDSGVGPTTTISAKWTEDNGSPASLKVEVGRPADHESLNVVIPWSETRFNFTTKAQTLPATGEFRLGDETVHFGATDSPAWGVLDVGRGRWPYSTTWNWGGGAGRAVTGEVVGLQFGAKWTEGTGFTENGVIIDGRLRKIGRELDWDYSWSDPMKPWRVSDSEDTLDVTLTPRFDKHSRTNAVLLRTEVHQVFGTWSGTVVTEDGSELQLVDAQGFAEESRSSW